MCSPCVCLPYVCLHAPDCRSLPPGPSAGESKRLWPVGRTLWGSVLLGDVLQGKPVVGGLVAGGPVGAGGGTQGFRGGCPAAALSARAILLGALGPLRIHRRWGPLWIHQSWGPLGIRRSQVAFDWKSKRYVSCCAHLQRLASACVSSVLYSGCPQAKRSTGDGWWNPCSSISLTLRDKSQSQLLSSLPVWIRLVLGDRSVGTRTR